MSLRAFARRGHGHLCVVVNNRHLQKGVRHTVVHVCPFRAFPAAFLFLFGGIPDVHGWSTLKVILHAYWRMANVVKRFLFYPSSCFYTEGPVVAAVVLIVAGSSDISRDSAA